MQTQAYQFQTTSENGYIRIPEEYKKLIGLRVNVTVVNDEQPDTSWEELFPPMIDTLSWKFNREDANER